MKGRRCLDQVVWCSLVLVSACLHDADKQVLLQGHNLRLPSPGERIDQFRLDCEVGDLIELSIDQEGVDIDVRLIAPNGALLSWDSPTGHWGRELVCFRAETEGSYTVAVGAQNPDEMGHYRVAVHATDAARLALFQAGYEAVEKLALGQDARSALLAAQQGWEQAGEFVQAFALLKRRADLERDHGRRLLLLHEGLRLLELAGDARLTAMAWHNLGVAYYDHGDHENALAAYERALAFRTEATRDRADTLTELGRCYNFVGAVARARAPLEEAQRIYGSRGHISSRGSLLALTGWNHHASGAYAEALEDYRQGLALIGQDHPRIAFNLHNYAAMTHIARGEPLTALTQLTLAESQIVGPNDFERRSVIAVNRAEALMLLARWQEALNLLDALPKAAFASPAKRAHIHYDQALALRALERLDEASRHIDEAMAIVTDNRHPAYLHPEFLASRLRYADLQLELEALIRTPQESLGRAETRHFRHVEPGVARYDRGRVRELGDRIGKHAWQVTPDRADPQLEALLVDYDAELQRGYRGEIGENTVPPPLEATPLRRNLLKNDTGLLYYALGTSRVFAWYVDRSHYRMKDLGARRELESLTLDYHEAVKDSSTGFARLDALGRHLGDALLKPILPTDAPRRLLIVPDGSLFHLPFAALPVPAQPSRPNGTLAESHEIIVLSSVAEALQLKSRPNPPNTTCLLLGNPEFGGDFTALTGAQRELRAIAEIAERSGLRCFSLEGKEATKKALLTHPELGRASLIHLATHGRYYAPRPELSSLVLATRDREGRVLPGFLYPQEINGLKLQAQLVVLSSCETALGRNQRVQGLDGFAGAFIRAGAQGVLVSLWPVEDVATAHFMTLFYRALYLERRSPSEALVGTQTAMIHDPEWSKPCYWAGFIYRGRW